MYDNHKEDYRDLFKLVDKIVDPSIKPYVKAECIFLTHNEKMHEYNIIHNVKGEVFLWEPRLQERKICTLAEVWLEAVELRSEEIIFKEFSNV